MLSTVSASRKITLEKNPRRELLNAHIAILPPSSFSKVPSELLVELIRYGNEKQQPDVDIGHAYANLNLFFLSFKIHSQIHFFCNPQYMDKSSLCNVAFNFYS